MAEETPESEVKIEYVGVRSSMVERLQLVATIAICFLVLGFILWGSLPAREANRQMRDMTDIVCDMAEQLPDAQPTCERLRR